MSWIWYVLYPVLAHLALSECVFMLAGSVLDDAACTALSALLILPLAIWWMVRRDASLHPKRHRGTAAAVAALAGCLLGGVALNILWSGLLDLLQVTSAFSNEAQEALFGSALLAQILGPGLLVPVAEEMIFRGLTDSRMRTKLNLMPAVLLSALLFALYHGNPIQMIYAFPMAVILALVYEKGGSILYPVLLHMGANLAAIILTAV